jgi:hypothetical protein
MASKEFDVWTVILLEVRILLPLFSVRLREWFQNIVHVTLLVRSVPNKKKHGPNYFPTSNSAPQTHFFFVKWDVMYVLYGDFLCPGIGWSGHSQNQDETKRRC